MRPLKAPSEELADLQVAFTEFGQHLLQQRMDLAFGKGHHPFANLNGALVVRE